uniref:Uncharacterized protein n=1 Tax=Megaselia scalaris TaxID=36166 RepID=T1GMC1_MEGSC
MENFYITSKKGGLTTKKKNEFSKNGLVGNPIFGLRLFSAACKSEEELRPIPSKSMFSRISLVRCRPQT